MRGQRLARRSAGESARARASTCSSRGPSAGAPTRSTSSWSGGSSTR
jgi:hypothetical protein